MAHRTVEQDQRWNVAPGKLPLHSREVDSQAFVAQPTLESLLAYREESP